MIITRTPLRISLVGGGTDLPSFYEKNGWGATLSFTIDKFVYIILNDRFDKRIRVSYSQTELVDKPDALQHELARECLKYMGVHEGVEIVSVSDIPGSGTGLGSSSAYTVGLLNALRARDILNMPIGSYDEGLDVPAVACEIEIEKCGKPIGKQDQYACALGGINRFQYFLDGDVVIKNIALARDQMEEMSKHMLLFFTGRTRKSATILAEQSRESAVRDKVAIYERMRDLPVLMASYLSRGDFSRMGDLLHKNWMLKRQLQDNISDEEIDKWYDDARMLGATGGKICGAGGGGFLLLWAPPETHGNIRNHLGLKELPFNIWGGGSSVAYMKGLNDYE